ncbi:MAG: ATP-dependent Clp protease proteolytic subunit [Hyphomicrobiaceae bacterium]|nr:peptidase [Hyphomicrobiaceae bacterium]
MQWRVWLFAIGICLAAIRIASGTTLNVSGTTALTVTSEPHRIVLAWSGPVEAPMQAKLAEALERFEDDPRKIVLSLHSPGGLVQHGHQVIKTIRKASHKRPIETLVEAGKTCASMCVPIYLVGAERSAHPSARFMFHEVRIKRTAESDHAMRDLQRRAPGVDVSAIQRQAEEHFTNELFDEDLGPRAINKRWLERVRSKIQGRDAWFTAQQLVKEDSGVVFALTK